MSYPERGEIYLVSLPGLPKAAKSRPALIVSMDVRNRLANDIIVIPISTTLRISPTHVKLDKGDGGLDKPSMAKCEQITTIHKSYLVRGPFSGAIPSEKMIEIEKAIQRAIGIVI